VASQTFAEFEYLVIDGASNDGSVEVIKKYADKITYWVSGPDTGVYNAMNKGIRQAQGNYCLFLNSGDWLIEPETLKDVFSEIAALETRVGAGDIYYSDCKRVNRSFQAFQPELNIKHLISGSISHQNALIKRSLFVDHGFYDESLKIASDWKFFLTECKNYHIKFVHISTCITVFDTTGMSITNQTLSLHERRTVLESIFGKATDLFFELRDLRNTIYFDVISQWGNSKVLDFMLKVYRFFARRLCKRRPYPYADNYIIK